VTLRKTILGLMAVGLVLASAVLAFGAFLGGPIGTQPDVTPQLRIVEPSIPFDAGSPIPVEIAYQNFDLQPQLRCNPAGPCTGSTPQTVTDGYAQGHIHVYFQRVTAGFENVDSDSFCIPTNVTRDGFNGTVAGNCPAVNTPGVYRVTAEFQSNSHINALKETNKPQDVPTSDAVQRRAR